MARSTYIYLITEQGQPFSAFTVKHEMESSLKSFCGNYTGIKIYRMKDSPSHWSAEKPVDITREFIGDE